MFLHPSLCSQEGCVCPIACWDTQPPAADTPLRKHPHRQTPPGQTHPLGRHPTRRTPPPADSNTTGYGQQAGGTHPTGMHTCFKVYLRNIAMLPFFYSEKLTPGGIRNQLNNGSVHNVNRYGMAWVCNWDRQLKLMHLTNETIYKYRWILDITTSNSAKLNTRYNKAMILKERKKKRKIDKF